MEIQTDYLRNVFDVARRKRILDELEEIMCRVMIEKSFDAIAFTGISGAGVAFILSDRLGIPLLAVRKDDSSHYVEDSAFDRPRYLEGAVGAKRFVIVDDQICTGTTIDRILNTIKDHNPSAKCVGIALYASSPFRYVYRDIPVHYVRNPY